jgi:hypothetical protein
MYLLCAISKQRAKAFGSEQEGHQKLRDRFQELLE